MENDSAKEGDSAPRYVVPTTELDDLATAIQNRVTRNPKLGELRQLHPGLSALLSNTVNVAHWTWRAIRMLTVEPRFKESPPKELAVAVPPLARALLDSLMTIVFVLDEPGDRTAWYYVSGWREARELQDDLVARHSADPDWTDYLQKHGAWVDSHEKDTSIGRAERAKPELATAKWPKPGWWPIPGRMPAQCAHPDRAVFLAYLYDRYYGELSQDAHLSYMGLARRGGILHDQHVDTLGPERYRSDNAFKALTFYLALLSEVAAYFGLTEQVTKLQTIWAGIPVQQATATDLWTRRYKKLLT